jgi:hypothetical protein
MLHEANRRKKCQDKGLRIYSILLSVLLLICAAKPGIGQVDQGTITGVVTDSTGAVVPNAQVTVTNVDTSLTLQGTTDNAGVYVFTPLKLAITT